MMVEFDVLEIAKIIDSINDEEEYGYCLFHDTVLKKLDEDKNFNYVPIVSGNDLLNLGFKQGPIIGKILREMYNLQLEEGFFNFVQAKEIIERDYINQ